MKVGLFLDVRNPPPWARPAAELYGRALEWCEYADGHGAGAIWLTEHHQFEDGYLTQPLVLAAAIAARTTRVRIGTAVLLAALRPAALIAEEAAVVDLVSAGRLELGFGTGYRPAEYELYGADFPSRRRRTEEALVAVRALLDGGVVTPAPVQRPVPLWLGYQGPRGARRAGELGVGLLSLRPDLLEPYRAGLRAGGHDPDSARLGGVLDLVVADDPERVSALVAPHRAYQLASYRAAHGEPGGDVGASVPSAAELGLAVLTPSDAVAFIRARTDGRPVEHVYTWASVAGMPDDITERHLELLCGSVVPALS